VRLNTATHFRRYSRQPIRARTDRAVDNMSFMTLISGGGLLYSFFSAGIRQPTVREGVISTIQAEPFLSTLFIVSLVCDVSAIAAEAKRRPPPPPPT